MSRRRFDPVILAPTRLAILAALAAAEWADFKFIRDSAELSDSALSKQLTILQQAGMVQIRKGAVGRRPHTWVNLTSQGRRSFEAHVAALKEIVDASANARKVG